MVSTTRKNHGTKRYATYSARLENITNRCATIYEDENGECYYRCHPNLASRHSFEKIIQTVSGHRIVGRVRNIRFKRQV